MSRVREFLQNYGVLVAFALLFLIASGKIDNFLTAENLRNLLCQNANIGVIALGMTFVIIAGGIDLSVGSLVALCGAAAVLTLNRYAPAGDSISIFAAIWSSVAVGSFLGMVNGVLTAYLRVAPFIVTLAGLAAYRSLALVLGNGGEIRSTGPRLDGFGFGGIPIPGARSATGEPVALLWSAVVFFALALAAGYVLNRTRFGRHVVAVGANQKAAAYSAIDTRGVRVNVYTILGALTGLAAFLNLARMNSVGTGSVGLYYELDAIAAVVIGGTSLQGGRGRIWGTVVGVVLMTLISNMMTGLHVDTNWQGLVRGLVILVAVLLQSGSKTSD